MNITILDGLTLGNDVSTECFAALGELTVYGGTDRAEVAERIEYSDVVIVNKIKLNRDNLSCAKKLKLICVAATGYDNIDIEYCRERGIAVCNVTGYSADSVAQLTLAMVLSLSTNLRQFCEYVRAGLYSQSGVANRLVPVYHELRGKTWGVLGAGSIGRQVAKCAEAIGCNVQICKKNPVPDMKCVDIDELCGTSDIITVHIPLNSETKGIINKQRIEMMKSDVIFVNVARGAVVDEAALADAVKGGRIGAIGVDVYSKEPFGKEHPFYSIKSMENVCLTPHVAWGAHEARERCLNEMVLNIKAFLNEEKRNRVDIV